MDTLGQFTSWLFLQVERTLSRVTDRIIALTDSERKDHLDRLVGTVDQFAVVPSGIDLNRFGQARVTRQMRAGMVRLSIRCGRRRVGRMAD